MNFDTIKIPVLISPNTEMQRAIIEIPKGLVWTRSDYNYRGWSRLYGHWMYWAFLSDEQYEKYEKLFKNQKHIGISLILDRHIVYVDDVVEGSEFDKLVVPEEEMIDQSGILGSVIIHISEDSIVRLARLDTIYSLKYYLCTIINLDEKTIGISRIQGESYQLFAMPVGYEHREKFRQSYLISGERAKSWWNEAQSLVISKLNYQEPPKLDHTFKSKLEPVNIGKLFGSEDIIIGTPIELLKQFTNDKEWK